MSIRLNPPMFHEIEFEPGLNPSNDRFCVIGKWRGFRSPGYGTTRAEAESDCQRSIQASFVEFYERNFGDRVIELPIAPAPLVPYVVTVAYETVYTVEVMLRSGATEQEAESAARKELSETGFFPSSSRQHRVYIVSYSPKPPKFKRD